MIHNIKNIILFFLILFFMYIILVRETIIEGKKGIGIKKGMDKADDFVDNTGDKIDNTVDNVVQPVANAVVTVVDYSKDSTSAAYNNLADAATQITEDVIGQVTGILGGALDSLASGVDNINGIFDSIDNSITNTSSKSANFESDVVNSINNSNS